MLHNLSHLYSCTRIRPILTQIFSHLFQTRFSSGLFKNNLAHNDSSSQKFSEIAKSVISKCSHASAAGKGDGFTVLSLKDYIFKLSDISPETVRRFYRAPALKPEDVLEILMGFEYRNGRFGAEVKMVESLWGVFMWASEQFREFEHLPLSCKIMASMLVQAGFYREVENLLSRRESQGFLLDCEKIFGDLIEGYVKEFELDRAVLVYERMRGLGLVPSMVSYKTLLNYLIEVDRGHLVYHVYEDMMNVGMGGSIKEKWIHENIIRLLCFDGRVQKARDLLRKVSSFGLKPSSFLLDAFICAYCDNKDYDDLLSFFTDLRVVPDVKRVNKILFSLCTDFGVVEASKFLLDMEELGFCPNEKSLGILIGSSCREGKLKNAFFHTSDIVSSGLKPHLYSYNALLSGLFKKGMSKHAREILVEMKDMGVIPDLSTYKVVLAGFCKARQFDEVKATILEMSDCDLIHLSSLEDPLAKGFKLVGLCPLRVKIRRDDNKGLSKTEFFDKLGNGLYLDADLDEYDNVIDQVLNDAMMPDFNSYIMEKSLSSDAKEALKMVDEMTKWGREMSVPTLISLFSRLSRAPFGVKVINHLLEVMPKSTYQLDECSLNMLVQINCKNGFTFRARTFLDGMLRRGYTIDNSTFSAFLLDACEKRDGMSLLSYLKLACKYNWSPDVKDGKCILHFMFKNKLFDEALELLDTMLITSFDDFSDIFASLLEELCCRGLTSTAYMLLDEFPKQNKPFYCVAYSRIISGFCKEKKFTKAYKVLETMVFSHSLPLPMEVSIQLISRLCHSNYEKAVQLKNMCLRDQSSPQLTIYSAFLKGICGKERFGEASILFTEVLVKGLVPDAEMLNTLILGYCRGNNLKKVLEIFGVMMRKNMTISASSYSKMTHLICRDEKFSLALSLKELMLRPNFIPELVLYNILIFHVSSTRNGFFLDAVIDDLQNKGIQFDNVTFDFVVRGFLLCKDASHSVHYLTAMMKRDFKPSNRSLRRAISRLCDNGEIELALNLSQEMESRGLIHDSSIQNQIVRTLLDKGRLDEAVEFLDRIALKGLIPDQVKYDRSIQLLCRRGRLDKSIVLLNIMLQKRSLPESTTYDCIVEGLCNGGNLDSALDFHTEMMHQRLKPSTFTWAALVRSLSEHARLDEAEGLIRLMVEMGETPRRETFECVIGRYRSEKNARKASEMLKMMQEKGYEPDFDTHWSVISNLSHCRKEEDYCSPLSPQSPDQQFDDDSSGLSSDWGSQCSSSTHGIALTKNVYINGIVVKFLMAAPKRLTS